MPIAKEKLAEILNQSFPTAKIEIIDLVGDENHYSVSVTDKIFSGKSRIEQHKLVNKALTDYLGYSLHAMQLKTSAN